MAENLSCVNVLLFYVSVCSSAVIFKVLFQRKHVSSVHPEKFVTQPPSLLAAKSYRKKTVASTWRRVAKTYLEESSIHGLKYVVQDRMHWLERVVWAAGVVASLSGAALFIRDIWRAASETPTATSVLTTNHPLSDVPFPAVTICPINRVQASAAARFYTSSGLASAGFSRRAFDKFIFNMVDMALPEDATTLTEDAITVQNFLKAKNYTLGQIMFQLSQPCEKMALQCHWKGKAAKCKDLFTAHRTDAGYCCSFNYHNRNESLAPMSSNAAGLLSGLTVLLDPQLEDYHSATFSFNGFQVLVHSPIDFPDVIARGHIVRPASETFLQVNAELTISTEAVYRLSLEQRRCLYPDECGYAGNHFAYSRYNCLVACRARYMRRRCGCVPYFYTSIDRTGRECNLADLPCLANNSWFFNSFKADKGELAGDGLEPGMSCDCYPGCMDMAYYLSSTSGWLFQSPYDTTTFFANITITNHTILHVYFKELAAVLFQRDVVYSWNDLVAAFGGVASLFLGCSVLSVLEFLDFFTLRLAFTFHQKLRKKRDSRGHPIITWLS